MNKRQRRKAKRRAAQAAAVKGTLRVMDNLAGVSSSGGPISLDNWLPVLTGFSQLRDELSKVGRGRVRRLPK
jgi:hypothetical protein